MSPECTKMRGSADFLGIATAIRDATLGLVKVAWTGLRHPINGPRLLAEQEGDSATGPGPVLFSVCWLQWALWLLVGNGLINGPAFTSYLLEGLRDAVNHGELEKARVVVMIFTSAGIEWVLLQLVVSFGVYLRFGAHESKNVYKRQLLFALSIGILFTATSLYILLPASMCFASPIGSYGTLEWLLSVLVILAGVFWTTLQIAAATLPRRSLRWLTSFGSICVLVLCSLVFSHKSERWLFSKTVPFVAELECEVRITRNGNLTNLEISSTVQNLDFQVRHLRRPLAVAITARVAAEGALKRQLECLHRKFQSEQPEDKDRNCFVENAETEWHLLDYQDATLELVRDGRSSLIIADLALASDQRADLHWSKTFTCDSKNSQLYCGEIVAARECRLISNGFSLSSPNDLDARRIDLGTPRRIEEQWAGCRK